MQFLKAKENTTDTSDIDQGYGSARTSPNLTPCASPRFHVSPASSTCSTSSRSYINVDNSYRHNPVPETGPYTVLDVDSNTLPTTSQDYHLPRAMDMTMQRVNNQLEYNFSRSRRLIEASFGTEPSTTLAVKRGLDTNGEIDKKRYRITTQVSQAVVWVLL